jgi:hypothetical protein
MILLSSYSIATANKESYKIIKLVNDQVITNYDLEKRLQLFALLNNVAINKENIDQYAKRMLSLMIDEKLQNEQIKNYNIYINDVEIESYITQAYIKNDQNINDLMVILENNNINISILNEFVRVLLGWNELSGRLYYRSSEINEVDLENIIKQDPSLSNKDARNILLQKQISLRAKKLLRDIRAEANIENR